jgi:hypothetical protein
MTDGESKIELNKSLRKNFIFTTIVTWALIIASIIVAIWAYKTTPLLSGVLIGLIPMNVQNWYESRPSKYFRN